jgi:hypothetical protein
MFSTFLTFLALITYRFSAHLQLPTLQMEKCLSMQQHIRLGRNENEDMVNQPRSLSSLFAFSPIDIVPKHIWVMLKQHVWGFDYAHFGCVMDSQKKHVMFPSVHCMPQNVNNHNAQMCLGSNKMCSSFTKHI